MIVPNQVKADDFARKNAPIRRTGSETKSNFGINLKKNLSASMINLSRNMNVAQPGLNLFRHPVPPLVPHRPLVDGRKSELANLIGLSRNSMPDDDWNRAQQFHGSEDVRNQNNDQLQTSSNSRQTSDNSTKSSSSKIRCHSSSSSSTSFQAANRKKSSAPRDLSSTPFVPKPIRYKSTNGSVCPLLTAAGEPSGRNQIPQSTEFGGEFICRDRNANPQIDLRPNIVPNPNYIGAIGNGNQTVVNQSHPVSLTPSTNVSENHRQPFPTFAPLAVQQDPENLVRLDEAYYTSRIGMLQDHIKRLEACVARGAVRSPPIDYMSGMRCKEPVKRRNGRMNIEEINKSNEMILRSRVTLELRKLQMLKDFAQKIELNSQQFTLDKYQYMARCLLNAHLMPPSDFGGGGRGEDRRSRFGGYAH